MTEAQALLPEGSPLPYLNRNKHIEAMVILVSYFLIPKRLIDPGTGRS